MSLSKEFNTTLNEINKNQIRIQDILTQLLKSNAIFIEQLNKTNPNINIDDVIDILKTVVLVENFKKEKPLSEEAIQIAQLIYKEHGKNTEINSWIFFQYVLMIYPELQTVFGLETTDLLQEFNNKYTKLITISEKLQSYTTNITELALNNKVDMVYGRDKEIERAIHILQRKNKNNPILIGEAGVGKTAIVEGIAAKIVNNEIPALKNKVILSLDLPRLLSGSRYRGELEERIQVIFDEIKQSNGNIILFIDEIHSVVGSGASSNNSELDISNMLKPELARGYLRCIGATTLDEYSKNIEKDPAFNRRFQKVFVNEPTVDECVDILQNVKKQYEEFHGVVIPNDIIKTIIQLSEKYIHDRFLPDKAIDIIDETASKFQNSGKTITVHDIEETIIEITGIYVNSELEKYNIQNCEDILKKNIFGQESAIHKVCHALKKQIIGLSNKQLAFSFVGEPHCGKYTFAKKLADIFNNSFIYLNMAQYSTSLSVTQLIGASAGYVGYNDGGYLTEIVKRNPYSVIYFDNIDQAHEDVIRLVSQIINNGTITDGRGRTIVFKHSIIICATEYVDDNDKEYLGETIYFNELERQDIQKIADIKINEIIEQLKEQDIQLIVDENIKEAIVSNDIMETINNIEELIVNKVSDKLINDKKLKQITLK